MSAYRHPAKPTHSEKAGEDWVDFPVSPDPDPWATLMREAGRLHADEGAKRVGGAVVTSVGIALRGLLVTASAVAIAAYLLLTNSHI
jgi:hypothetical protein